MEVAAETQAKLESLTKLPKAARIGILAVVGVLISCGYYFGFYQASSEELERLQGQELGLQRKLSEVRSVASNICLKHLVVLQRYLDYSLKKYHRVASQNHHLKTEPFCLGHYLYHSLDHYLNYLIIYQLQD